MKILLTLIVTALLVPAATASAAVTATPFSDPSVPAQQGTPLTTLFTNTAASPVTIDLNANINYGGPSVTVSNGSTCPNTYIKRGLYRWRCKVPANGEVVWTNGALYSSYAPFGMSAFEPPSTAYPSGRFLAGVTYLTYPKDPAAPYVPPVNCRYKGWGYWVAPASCTSPFIAADFLSAA